MSKTVWKFPLAPRTTVPGLIDPQVVLVGLDGALLPCVWVEHTIPDPEDRHATTELDLHVAGTGHDVDSAWRHVGSFVDTSYVWHVYQEPTPEPT